MPIKFSDLTTQAISAKLPPEQVEWLQQQARSAESMTGVLRRLVEDARSLYGVPPIVRERLEADMRAQGIHDERDYLIHLLMLRYNETLSQDVSSRRPIQSLGRGVRSTASKK